MGVRLLSPSKLPTMRVAAPRFAAEAPGHVVRALWQSLGGNPPQVRGRLANALMQAPAAEASLRPSILQAASTTLKRYPPLRQALSNALPWQTRLNVQSICHRSIVNVYFYADDKRMSTIKASVHNELQRASVCKTHLNFSIQVLCNAL